MLLITITIYSILKVLKLNNIKIQNDVLTKKMIMGKGIKSLSTIGGIINSGLFIFSCIYPDIISRTAESVAMGASTMLSRVNTLVNVGYGEELDNDRRSSFLIYEPTTSVASKVRWRTTSKARWRITNKVCSLIFEKQYKKNI